MNDILLGLKRIPLPCVGIFCNSLSNPLPVFTSLSGSVTAQGCLHPFYSNYISFPTTQGVIYGCVALINTYYYSLRPPLFFSKFEMPEESSTWNLSNYCECRMNPSQGFLLSCYWLLFWMSLESIAKYLLHIYLVPHPVFHTMGSANARATVFKEFTIWGNTSKHVKYLEND